MNELLGTGMKLQYSPLGIYVSNQQSTNWNTSDSQGTSQQSSSGGSSNVGGGTTYNTTQTQSSSGPLLAGMRYAEGGFVPDEISKSGGGKVDDVPANLTSGEFIIPRDIVEWKGQEFFYKLMAATRKLRATAGDDGSGQAQLGYGAA
jgi:hypothetical protein